MSQTPNVSSREAKGVESAPDEELAVANWHSLESDQVLAELRVTSVGLTSTEAAQRLEQYGPNELSGSQKKPWYVTLGKQFISPMIGILAICFLIMVVIQDWVDAIAILFILLLNAGLGFWQERKTERDVQALANLSAPDARVLRDGHEETVPASQLVPGDIVVLASGDRTPADVRLIETSSLRVNESMLTGESEAASKNTAPVESEAGIGDRLGMAYSGTLVETGRARAVVVGTGASTELGAINELVKGPTGKTPLEILTHSLEKRIGLIIAGASVVLFVAGLILGQSAAEMFKTVVALAVAVIPESLPIVLTVAMSVGVSRMVERNALVRSLPAVETLGSTTVIGSDKTGTLTINQMTVTTAWTNEGTIEFVPSDQGAGKNGQSTLVRHNLYAGAQTNEAVRDAEGELRGDAVDVAMAQVALANQVVTDAERSTSPLAQMPYESELKMSQTVREIASNRVLLVKGSPDAILEASTSVASSALAEAQAGTIDFSLLETAPLDAEEVERTNDAFAAKGLRIIATAFRVLDDNEELAEELAAPSDLVFLGLEGMVDPPRPGVAEAVSQCRTAGIRVIMITGDHPTTAVAIAEQLGLEASAEPLTGKEIQTLSDAQLLARLKEVGVAARVSPADKMRIVEVLQDDGETVAVTGDGVNDAPALKAASLGVAMGESGTDVARDAADVVLTDDNFVTVVDAVEQGRVTFNAIRKATHFLLATGVASLVAMTLSVFADVPLIFLPLQMLFINVVTNGIQDIALAFESAEGDELQRPPRSANEGILSTTLWIRTAIVGLWMAMTTFLTFSWCLQHGIDETHARTLALTLFVWMNFYFVQTCRFENRPLLSNPFGNRILLVSSVGAMLLFWGAMTWTVTAGPLGVVALSAKEWLFMALLALPVFLVVELDKMIRRKLTERKKDGTFRGSSRIHEVEFAGPRSK